MVFPGWVSLVPRYMCYERLMSFVFFFFQAEDGIRDVAVTGVQTCALPISPVTLPGPISWWHKPKVRRRVIAVAVLAGVYVLGLSYGAWTRVCAGEHCPSISRLGANPNHQVQTSKVYAADGRLISELGAERRTVLPLTDIPLPGRPGV